jgi:hypothetical protein
VDISLAVLNEECDHLSIGALNRKRESLLAWFCNCFDVGPGFEKCSSDWKIAVYDSKVERRPALGVFDRQGSTMGKKQGDMRASILEVFDGFVQQ